MDNSRKKPIIFRSALHWGAAMIAPPVVMVILDFFDMHNQNTIPLFSSMVMMAIFVLHNGFLSKTLDAIGDSEQHDTDEAIG